MLFILIAIRMAGFVFLNPILGRRNIPAMVKTGLSMALTVTVYSTAVAAGYTDDDIEADSSVFFGILVFKEFMIGYFLGYIMQLFDMIMTFAGTVTDFQMGISMAQVYDPQSGGQVALTGNIFQIFFLLLFFAVDGHLALMKIIVTSGDVVPYGQVAIAEGAAWMVLDIFTQCVVLAVKMSFPIIAFEFIVQLGIGILMKVNPQINLFVMSIQLKLTVGLLLLCLLVSPIGAFIENAISQMMDTLVQVLGTFAG